MTTHHASILILILMLSEGIAIWPPSYKINLSQEETFVISEVLTSDDTHDVYEMEDEMIQDEQLKQFKLENDRNKYLKLHKLSIRQNKENIRRNDAVYNKRHLKKPPEVNNEEDELTPWEGGFVDKNGDFKPVMTKVHMEKPTKNLGRRENENVSDEISNYDYSGLKAEYYSNVIKAKDSNETLNYTETKEEESFGDAVKVIIGDKTKPRNCTVEEKKGIGLKAAECFWLDLTTSNLGKKEKSAIFHRIGIIILIWLLVYLLVAIPCWCQRGWCCCCFQCKFCKPLQRINGAKKYLLDNPVGVYHTPEKQKCTYNPTNYERYAQKKLEKALLKL